MTPRLVLDEGTDTRENIAKSADPKIQDLPVFVVGNTTFSRWTLTDEERRSIAEGGDVLVGVLNAGHPLHPLVPMALNPEIFVAPSHLEDLERMLCAG